MNFIQAQISMTDDKKVYMIQRVAYKQFKEMLAQYLAAFQVGFDQGHDGSIGGITESVCGVSGGGGSGSGGGGGSCGRGTSVHAKKAWYLTGPRCWKKLHALSPCLSAPSQKRKMSCHVHQ